MRTILIAIGSSLLLSSCVGQFSTAYIEAHYQGCLKSVAESYRPELRGLCESNREWSYNRRFSMSRIMDGYGGGGVAQVYSLNK